jgi:hypothetical protein
MDAMGIAKLATSIATTDTADAVNFAMLKKAQDVETSTAAQMLSTITPMPSAQKLPSHLGNTINTTA